MHICAAKQLEGSNLPIAAQSLVGTSSSFICKIVSAGAPAAYSTDASLADVELPASGLLAWWLYSCMRRAQISAMGELESLYETDAGQVLHACILNLEHKSTVINPYRSTLPAANIQARPEPEELSSNAVLEGKAGEGRGEEKKKERGR